MPKPKTNRGFTIIELLVVIVVIGILAAISIVAYSGIQDRARNVAANQTATQLVKKIEIFHAIDGNYPAPPSGSYGTSTGAQLASRLSSVPEANIDASFQAKIANSIATLSEEKVIHVANCATGAQITYWQSGGNSNYKRIDAGAC